MEIIDPCILFHLGDKNAMGDEGARSCAHALQANTVNALLPLNVYSYIMTPALAIEISIAQSVK